MNEEYRQLNFVLKIDKELNVIYFRNLLNSPLLKEPTSAYLKKTRLFQFKAFAQINRNTSIGIVASVCMQYRDITIINLDSNKCAAANFRGQIGYVYCIEQIDENRFASGAYDIKIWSTKTFECLKTLVGHRDPSLENVQSLKSLPLNKIASCSLKEIKIWDLESGDCLLTLKCHSYHVNSLICLPNGNLVSGSSDETLQVWDLYNGKCIKTLRGLSYDFYLLVLLDNGHVASGSGYQENKIKIWSMYNGQCMKSLKGHSDWINGLEALESGELISCSRDTTIKVWNVTKGICIRTLLGHTENVRAIRVNNQNNTLVSYSNKRTIKTWNVRTGKCLNTIEVNSGEYLILI